MDYAFLFKCLTITSLQGAQRLKISADRCCSEAETPRGKGKTFLDRDLHRRVSDTKK